MITDTDPTTLPLTTTAASAPARVNRQSSIVNFTLPPDEAAAYASQVPQSAIAETRRLLAILQDIHHAPKIKPACERHAATLQRAPAIVAAGDRLLRRKTWSAHTLRTKYYQYLNGTNEYPAGDWRILLDKAKAPIDRATATGEDIPVNKRPAFVEFWRSLGERNQQDWSAAYDELIQIWKTGYGFTHSSSPSSQSHPSHLTRIPGYTQWPKEDPSFHHPAGWSYANLMRMVSDPYDQDAARHGYAKATKHRIPVLTTRTKIHFGQYFEFDDHEFNQKVLFQKKPMRPLGFGAVEVFSANIALIGCKPTLWDYEAEAKLKLTEREFMWFVVAFLTTIGYRADIGTEFIVERGTAAIRGDRQNRPITDALRTDLEKRIFDTTSGKVTVFRGGRHGRPAHDGQFRGQPKGNPKTKALLEGTWHIVDNQLASLPAQTGRDRDHAPEQLYGQEQYTAQIFRQLEALQKAGTPLTAEQIEMLQFPFPPYWQWREWMLDSVHRINTTRRHTLEGWATLGFDQPIWRLSDGDPDTDPAARWLPWKNYLALPEAQRALIKSMLDTNAALVSSVRLNRDEVFRQNRPALTTVPFEMLPGLVGLENALDSGNPIEVKSGLFSFDCAEIDPDTLHFYARRADGTFLPNGEKYVCFVNPYAPLHLVACEPVASRTGGTDLKVVAVCPRYIRGSRNDQASIDKLMGAQSAFEAQARVRLNLRHGDAADAKRAMVANNARLLSSAAPASGTPPPISTRGISQDDFTTLDGTAGTPADRPSAANSQESALNELD